MKALTFLGPTNYSFTKYRYRDKVVPTRFFAEALPHFFPEIEAILVFATPTVQRHDNLEELKSRLGNLLQPIPIPESHTEKDLWKIFEALVDKVDEGERVIFDITNSYRSLPFVVFMAATFLRAARNVRVEAVLYGAFEARSEENISPVFDLTPFLSLFDWLTATNQFLYTGNARYLAAQLERHGKPELQPLAENVRQIARNLDLLRPRDVARVALDLPQHLRAVESALPHPFAVLAHRLNNAYSRFGVSDPDAIRDHLRSQYQMIRWYFEKERYVHTLSMAREWVVSLMCLEFDLDPWDKNAREEMELLLNGGKQKDKSTGQTIYVSPYLTEWESHPLRKQVVSLWSGRSPGLANLRNDVLHSGFRKNPRPADEIVKQIGDIVDEIDKLARLWQIID